MISGLVAAAAVMVVGAAPAMACGFGGCSPCGYVDPCAPVVASTYSYGYGYGGCNSGCGGWGFDRLAEPATQYYYVNQGPTYTGPGAFAPYPTYREDAVVVPGGYGYHRPYRYGYGPRYGYLPRVNYGYGARYGYAHRYAPYHYGPRPLRRYY
jgi:hypothetical protein